jgi:DNA-binding TFAR19-related protein (PDSD5 family)
MNMAEDEELERIKKGRLDTKKAQEQLRTTLRMALEEQAYERLMNVAIANNELFLNAAKNALMFYKRAGRKLSDGEILALLRAIKEQNETKTTITFHKK